MDLSRGWLLVLLKLQRNRCRRDRVVLADAVTRVGVVGRCLRVGGIDGILCTHRVHGYWGHCTDAHGCPSAGVLHRVSWGQCSLVVCDGGMCIHDEVFVVVFRFQIQTRGLWTLV